MLRQSLLRHPSARYGSRVLHVAYRSQSTSSTPPTNRTGQSSAPAVEKMWLPKDQGISPEFGAGEVFTASINGFMMPEEERRKMQMSSEEGPLPCDVVGSQAAHQAAQAERRMNRGDTSSSSGTSTEAIKRPTKSTTQPRSTTAPSTPSSLPKRAPSPPHAARMESKAATEGVPRKPLLRESEEGTTPPSSHPSSQQGSSPPKGTTSDAKAQEASEYYRSLQQNAPSKDEMWSRIKQSTTKTANEQVDSLDADEIDYIQVEEDLQKDDLFHYRMGELAFPDDVQMRRDYYAMWALVMSLNRARWTMLEVQSQRGMKTTAAGLKLLYWKEAVYGIVDHRKMVSGQFVDSHPVLRSFASSFQRHPRMTKSFVRGFTDARLKIIQQPGSVKQLCDHFDKFYGYFFNSLLQMMNVESESAEHMMLHIGRATGLTTHCVMFWKKYARLGFTMLPADLCADNNVNLGLLKNVGLASRDMAVRKLLFDVMSIAKDEMLHAQALVEDIPPTAWPVVMECLYANYYLGFLQRRKFDVSAMFADYNIENAGFVWYRLKKRWEWEQHQSIERLVNEAAPLPYIGTSISHRGSDYKRMADFQKKKK